MAMAMAMAMAEPEPLAAQHSARDLHTLRPGWRHPVQAFGPHLITCQMKSWRKQTKNFGETKNI